MTNSTLEHLVLYMYNESDPARKIFIEKELEDNWTLREKLNVLKNIEVSRFVFLVIIFYLVLTSSS